MLSIIHIHTWKFHLGAKTFWLMTIKAHYSRKADAKLSITYTQMWLFTRVKMKKHLNSLSYSRIFPTKFSIIFSLMVEIRRKQFQYQKLNPNKHEYIHILKKVIASTWISMCVCYSLFAFHFTLIVVSSINWNIFSEMWFLPLSKPMRVYLWKRYLHEK